VICCVPRTNIRIRKILTEGMHYQNLCLFGVRTVSPFAVPIKLGAAEACELDLAASIRKEEQHHQTLACVLVAVGGG